MNVKEAIARTRALLMDLGGALAGGARASARALGRGWLVARPRLERAGSAVGARARAAWVWLRPRLAAAWAAAARRARSVRAAVARVRPRIGRVARALRRPLFVAARTTVIAAACAAAVLAAGLFLVRTPPGAVDVRQRVWGGSGVVERDYGPGLHFSLPGRDGWHRLSAGSHLVSFAWKNEGGTHPILDIATREGESAQAAVAVFYRIRAGEAWKLVADGLRTDYPGRAVAICRRVLLEELAALSVADCVDPEARSRVEASALARLDAALGAAHLEPTSVRIGSMYFNQTYEKKLHEKQLATQDGLTQASIARRKEEERENARVLAELEASEAAIVAEVAGRMRELRDRNALEAAQLEREAKRYQARMRSDTDVAVLRLKNEGELALAAAEGLRRTLFENALQGRAGRLQVALKAAENLRFGKVTLDSKDPRVPSVLDLDGMVQMLVGKDEAPR